MIDANELRIGNKVRNDIHCAPDLAIDIYVGEICDGYIVQQNISPSHVRTTLPFSELSGIPLTPEILGSYGFEKNTVYEEGIIFYESGEIEIQIVDNGFYLGWVNETGYWGDVEKQIRSIELKHLHQLQNLYFALTGKELKVNLFK